MSRKRGEEDLVWAPRATKVLPSEFRKDGRPNGARKRLKVGECRNCGKQFILREVYGRIHDILIPFCHRICSEQWNDRRVREIRAAGLPLITFIQETETIVCEVCGKHLKKTIGSHMQTHGLNTGDMGNLERQLTMGLYKGQRCATDAQRERMKLNGRYDLVPPPGNKFPADYAELQALVPLSPESQKGVRIGQLKGALLMHERACTTRVCKRPECGVEFPTTKKSQKIYCSPECRQLNLLSGPPRPSPMRGRKRVGFSTHAARAEHVIALQREGMSREEIAAATGLSLRQVKRTIYAFNQGNR